MSETTTVETSLSIGVKLAIRTDTEAGFVRAYMASLDGKAMREEIGSVAIAALDGHDGPRFRAWLEVMRQCMAAFLADVLGDDAAELKWTGDMNPADLETEPQG